MRVVLIIQARMGSIRLPGKSMMELAGKPLLARIFERVKRCKKVDLIVLATTQKPQDDVLVGLAREYGIEVFRGSETDLVDRYYQAARRFQADVVARLAADNPVVEPAEIDRIIEYHLKGESDFLTNTHDVNGNGYPDGLGAEAFDVKTLEEVWNLATEPPNREHLHTYFLEHPQSYRIGTVSCPEEFRRPDLVLDVNTLEEYEFIRRLYEDLYPVNSQFHITDIIHWYDRVWLSK